MEAIYIDDAPKQGIFISYSFFSEFLFDVRKYRFIVSTKHLINIFLHVSSCCVYSQSLESIDFSNLMKEGD